MRNIITVLLFLFAFTTQAQDSKPVDHSGQVYQIDTAQANSISKSVLSKLDSLDMARSNENSYRYFTELGQESNRKARQQMWLRIGLGVGFAVIGVVGLMRKKKVKKEESKV